MRTPGATERKRQIREITRDMDPLNVEMAQGLFVLGFFGALSVASTLLLVGFIGYRFIFWERYYKTDIRKNISIFLVWNLILADMFQAMSFLIAFHWLRLDAIKGSSRACGIQGFLINFGDIASAFFVAAIALSTWVNVGMKRSISYRVMVGMAIVLWIVAFVLSIIGPLSLENYFVPTGAWCWANPRYKLQRLAYHYIWIFLVEFGLIVVYACVYYELRRMYRQVKEGSDGIPLTGAAISSKQLSRRCAYSVLYPLVYVVLTLPLAAGRMVAMKYPTYVPDHYWCIAGALITSCGWVDTILYFLTRKKIFQNELQPHRADSISITSPYRTNPCGCLLLLPISPTSPLTLGTPDGFINTPTAQCEHSYSTMPIIHSPKREQILTVKASAEELIPPLTPSISGATLTDDVELSDLAHLRSKE